MLRRTLLYATAAISVIIIIVGVVGYSVLLSFQSPQGTPNPNPTTTPSQTPNYVWPTPSGSISQELTAEYVRDIAAWYIELNHVEAAGLFTDISWSGGRTDSAGVGSETYVFNGGDWAFTLQCPVVVDPP